MDVVELIEIALANADDRRIEVTALEPAEFSTRAVAGLAELISELVGNAIAFSQPDEKVHVAGLFDQDSYLISISDRGVGIPDELMGGLNRMLEDVNATVPDAEATLGIPLVARLAARHDIAVQLVPGVPGTTARVTVPAELVTRMESKAGRQAVEPVPAGGAAPQDGGDELVVGSSPGEPDDRPGMGRVLPPSEPRRESAAFLETEAFLEKIFAPLMREFGESDRPLPPSGPNGGNSLVEMAEVEAPAPVERRPSGVAAVLRVRVPGENFSTTEDEPSTAAAEAAIDIRSALSTFDQGRRLAELTGDQEQGSERDPE